MALSPRHAPDRRSSADRINISGAVFGTIAAAGFYYWLGIRGDQFRR